MCSPRERFEFVVKPSAVWGKWEGGWRRKDGVKRAHIGGRTERERSWGKGRRPRLKGEKGGKGEKSEKGEKGENRIFLPNHRPGMSVLSSGAGGGQD